MIANAKLKDFFSAIVYGDDVQNSKPAPDIFLLAAQKIGISPRSCCVIEDSRSGILAAKSAGMAAFGFQNLSSSQNLDAADFIFTDFEDLDLGELKKWCRITKSHSAPSFNLSKSTQSVILCHQLNLAFQHDFELYLLLEITEIKIALTPR